MTTILILSVLAIVLIRYFFPNKPSCRIHGTEYMREKGYYGDTWCYKCWKEKKK